MRKILERVSDSFWISPSGKEIIPLDGTHISFIVSNPKKFGLTKDYIEETYDKYNEPMNKEGDARKEIIKEVSKRGWIRVRHYFKPDYWSIQCDSYSNHIRTRTIKKFLEWAIIDKGIMDEQAELRILSYDTDYLYVVSWNEGGAITILEKLRKKKITMFKKVIENGIIKYKTILKEDNKRVCYEEKFLDGYKVFILKREENK